MVAVAQDKETNEWLKEMTSAIGDKYKEILATARESMFDIFVIVPHKALPKTYIGEDVLGNEIAMIWTEGIRLIVKPISTHGKRMN
jgi:hypothetical protein